MKRSQINTAIKRMEKLLEEYRFALPGFCAWTAEDWLTKGEARGRVTDRMLGWDITDFGLGGFDKIGLTLITIRNGRVGQSGTKPYAEKIMMLKSGQLCPMHFHWTKTEDIINRGGGRLCFKLYGADKDEGLSRADLTLDRDEERVTLPAGGEIALLPGESLTLPPRAYHQFWVPEDSRDTLIGEVSSLNDDNADNRFYEPIGRFPGIEEDEPMYRRLVIEYPAPGKRA